MSFPAQRLTLTAAVAAGLALAAAAPAAADSISFLRGGDVWVSSPDGATQVQVTHDGGYSHQSQADDGTFIALKDRRLHRIGRDGKLLADFDTPVSGTVPGAAGTFRGPYEPEISPDGRVVAYEYFYTAHEQKPGCLPVGEPACQVNEYHAGVGYTHADRQTSWDEPGLGRQSGWMDPAWNPDGSVLLSDKNKRPNLDLMVDRLGNGNQVIDGWFEDSGVWYVGQAEMTRQENTIAAVTTRAKSSGEEFHDNDQVTVYRTNGAPPALPDSCYAHRATSGSETYWNPSWSPDGSRLAFGRQIKVDGTTSLDVLVAEVPDQAGGCSVPTEGADLAIRGAQYPDWGPADVPSPGSAAPRAPAARGGDGAPRSERLAGDARGEAALEVRRRALRVALVKGLIVRASGLRPGRVTLRAQHRGSVIAHGTGAARASGTATVRLRFTPAARRSLRRAKRVPLRVQGGGASLTLLLKR